jgi:3-oxoacyl-[acyl-carrier-protein] synthase II
LGNTVAATGTIEFIAGVLALENGAIPHTINYTRPDPNCPLCVVTGAPRELKKASFLSADCTRLGQAAAVVVRNLEG